MTADHTATFAVTPERFIIRLLDCHALEVDFPLADEARHVIFDVTGLEKEINNFPRAKKALKRADCRLVNVNGPRRGRVKEQKPRPGTVLAPGGKVRVELG